jgi:hypothetical protein
MKILNLDVDDSDVGPPVLHSETDARANAVFSENLAIMETTVIPIEVIKKTTLMATGSLHARDHFPYLMRIWAGFVEEMDQAS